MTAFAPPPGMYDLTLVLVPQWSPFQPCLSLPSLAAWLRREGFRVRCLDANLLFYEFLFGPECAGIAISRLDSLDLPARKKWELRSIFRAQEDFRRDAFSLRPGPVWADRAGKGDDLTALMAGFFAFKSYIQAISTALGDVEITPWNFRVAAGRRRASNTEEFADRPPGIVAAYMDWFLREHVLRGEPSAAYGLSCLAQSQLAFTLLFGRRIKAEFDRPVVVGGTIFPRLLDLSVLPARWFGKYFDVVVRNEGERPCAAMLENQRAGRALVEGVPGIVYRTDRIERSTPAPALRPAEIPVPDFDGMPLGRYFSPEIVLPVLSARGCYWRKCEFCHHSMTYGERFSPYSVRAVADSIRELSAKHDVRAFSFNDEAIPPRTLKALAESLPDHEETSWLFEGQIKFERSYSEDLWPRLRRVGFRRFCCGLESASDRVLRLIGKHCERETIVANLRDATRAGLLMHCFLFFGFPGETEEDARTTYDFVLDRSDVVGWFGAGTFAYEHGAPVSRHPEDFGLEILKDPSGDDITVFSEYRVTRGISPERARAWALRLNTDALELDKYRALHWLGNEHNLYLLRSRDAARLVRDLLATEGERERILRQMEDRRWRSLEPEELVQLFG